MERQVGAPSTPQRDLPPCGDGLRSLEMHAWWSPEKAEVCLLYTSDAADERK